MEEERSRRNHPYIGTNNTKPNAIWPGDSNDTNVYMDCDVDSHIRGSEDRRWREEASEHQKMVEHNAAFSKSHLINHPTAYVYSQSCFGAYGSQAMVHSPYLGGHNTRMILPLEMTEEPVYVNAKQYHGILRRRQSRAKAELENKVTKVRKPYLHESRHLHAMRRARGCGGRFLNTTKRESKTASCVQSTRPANPTAEETRLQDLNSNYGGNGQYGQNQTLQFRFESIHI